MMKTPLRLLALVALLLLALPASGDSQGPVQGFSVQGASNSQQLRYQPTVATCRTTSSAPVSCFTSAIPPAGGSLATFRVVWSCRDVTSASANNAASGIVVGAVENISGTITQVGGSAFSSTQMTVSGSGVSGVSLTTTLGSSYSINVAVSSSDTFDWTLYTEEFQN